MGLQFSLLVFCFSLPSIFETQLSFVHCCHVFDKRDEKHCSRSKFSLLVLDIPFQICRQQKTCAHEKHNFCSIKRLKVNFSKTKILSLDKEHYNMLIKFVLNIKERKKLKGRCRNKNKKFRQQFLPGLKVSFTPVKSTKLSHPSLQPCAETQSHILSERNLFKNIGVQPPLNKQTNKKNKPQQNTKPQSSESSSSCTKENFPQQMYYFCHSPFPLSTGSFQVEV